MPIYASPEQFMRDRSEYARKGIARGRSVVATKWSGGVLFVAENHSPTLHKVSEIYDRIGFAGVGRYNEFENLRTAGIRLADVRGYSYDRRDVSARWLVGAYAQTLGSIFSEHQKPFEVELCVAEVGRPESPNSDDQLYKVSFDGSISDEAEFVVMGGLIEPVATSLGESYTEGWDLPTAMRAAVKALGTAGENPPRTLTPNQVEVAILDRHRTGRTFRRVVSRALEALLETPAPDEPDPSEAPVPADPPSQVVELPDPPTIDQVGPDGTVDAPASDGQQG